MDAIQYIYELRRMCDYYSSLGQCGAECPRRFVCEEAPCEYSESDVEMFAMVENWSKAHPIKTNGDMILEVVHNIINKNKGSNYIYERNSNKAYMEFDASWWNMEYEEK